MNSSLIASLMEMREVAAALFRAIDKYGQSTNILNYFEQEMARLGISPGFGVRCQEAIKSVEEG